MSLDPHRKLVSLPLLLPPLTVCLFPSHLSVSEAVGQLTGAWPWAHLSPKASPCQVRTALGRSGLWAAVSVHVWTLSHGFRRTPWSQALKPHAPTFNGEEQRGEGTLRPHFSLFSIRRMPVPVAPNKPPLQSLDRWAEGSRSP